MNLSISNQQLQQQNLLNIQPQQQQQQQQIEQQQNSPAIQQENFNNSQIYSPAAAAAEEQVNLNLNDLNNKNNLQIILDTKISDTAKQKINEILNEVAALSSQEKLLLYLRLPVSKNETDPLRQPQNPLGTRAEINHTINWVRSHLEHDPKVSIPKQDVYNDYMSYCERLDIKPLSTADFGKVMKQVFPEIKPRRLGTRGHSRYCYAAMRKATKLNPPKLPNLDNSNQTNFEDISNENWSIIKNWAENILSSSFDSVNDLTSFLTKQNSSKQKNPISASSDITTDFKNKRKYSQKPKVSPCSKKKRNKKRKDSAIEIEFKPNADIPKDDELNFAARKAESCQPINLTANKNQHFIFSQPTNPSSTGSTIRHNDFSMMTAGTNEYDIKKEILDSSYAQSYSSVSLSKDQQSIPPDTKILTKDVKFENDKSMEIVKEQHHQQHHHHDLKKLRPYELDANVISKNKAQLRAKRFALIARDGDDIAEKDDVLTENLGLPRERVISICNMDKHELDDYLNGENSLDDQEVELVQYFQNDERRYSFGALLSGDNEVLKISQSSKFSKNNEERRSSLTKKENIANLRNYLQQNLQQQHQQHSLQSSENSASASLAFMSKRHNTPEKQLILRRKMNTTANLNSRNFNFVPISENQFSSSNSNTINNNVNDSNINTNVNNNNFISPSAPPSPSLYQQKLNSNFNNGFTIINNDKLFNYDNNDSLNESNYNNSMGVGNSGGGENFEFNRSQSVPLQTKIYSGFLSECNSVNQTPVPSEFADFNEPFIDILQSDNKSIKLESNDTSSSFSSNIPPPAVNQILTTNKSYLLDSPALSRSNPVTPVPGIYNTSTSFAFNNNKFNRQKYDESKSVPTTPLDIGCAFTYSPIESNINRDCLINGNNVDNISNNFFGSELSESGLDNVGDSIKKSPLKKVPFPNNDLNLNSFNADSSDVLENL